MTEQPNFAALDDEIDSIMNVPSPDTAKKKRQFGIRRGLAEHTEHKPTNVNRRDTGFGRPSKASSAAASAPIRKKPRSMGNHSWAHNDPVPSFAVSAISTSSTRYSTSNQFIKQPPSHHRQNIPSSKIIPGHALMRTEATRQTTAALPPATTTRAATGASYSKPHKNLMTVSRPVQPGILEAYSGGKSWTPHHAMSLTPPGKKPPAKSIPSTSRRRSLTPAAASTPDNDMCDTRHPLRQKRVPSGPPRVTDDMFYHDAPTVSRRIIPASAYGATSSNRVADSKQNSTTQPNRVADFEQQTKRNSGGTAEKPIHLSDSENEDDNTPIHEVTTSTTSTSSTSAPDNWVELPCQWICYQNDRLRHETLHFTHHDMRWGRRHVVLYTSIAELLRAPSFFVVVLKSDQFVVVQPVGSDTSAAAMERLRETLQWSWRDLRDTEYAKYNNMLLETTNTKKARPSHRVAEPSPIVLVYPLPPHVTDVISITQNDLDRLQPAEYLNDNLVDYYFKWLVAVDLPASAAYCTILSSHFYSQLRDDYNNVATWFSKDLLDNQLIFVPINLQTSHRHALPRSIPWATTTANPRSRVI
ncbi:hypothetical protein, variant [Aphanomyces astaci]|uniref:Ubiquitin-like protease family profile domain-containing protein n=1 Tax=Aphanomyces astaci TaxID=112090 RepID=W4FXA5_APHAT|nr:hypothetical protein, variant [Aphanomyces astaci]ETV71293.1 hypothetical protein, variant [Aphanomyces astaci]|eukprot:XP_009839233.1 hypothetical protein, variant [Aphanomyces astaci]